MANKPFEIQSPTLSLNGVNIDTSAQGKLVIPGVTRAGTSVAIEVEDTGDQTTSWNDVPVIIDGYEYASLNGDLTAQVGWQAAVYTADAIDEDGYIDGITVVNGGAGYTGEAVTYSQTMYAAPLGTVTYPFNASEWTEIPYRVRCGAGEIESELGGGGGINFDGDGAINLQGEGIVRNTVDSGNINIVATGYSQLQWTTQTGAEESNPNNTNEPLNWLYVEQGGVYVETNKNAQIGNSYGWQFNTSGGLEFPDGTTQTTAYTGQSSSGGSILVPLPSWLETIANTNQFPILNTDYGYDSNGVWTVNATIGVNNEGTSYPFRTSNSINCDTPTVITVDFSHQPGSMGDSDFGIGVFAAGTDPIWAWDSTSGNQSANRIGAQYNGSNPELHGISGGADTGEAWGLPSYGTYRARLTITPVDPGVAEITLETMDTSDNVLNTISYTEENWFTSNYKIGFASDQDGGSPKVYFKNLTIDIGNGSTVYTDALTGYSSALVDTGTGSVNPYIWTETLSYSNLPFLSPYVVSATEYDGNGNLYALVNNYDDNGPSFTTLMKLNALGTVVAQVEFADDFQIDGWGLAVDVVGNVYISGSANPNNNGADVFVSKLNTALEVQWTQTYGADNNDIEEGFVIDISNNGDPVVVGTTNANNSDLIVMKINQDTGLLKWQRRVAGVGNQSAYGMAVGWNGETVLVGTNFNGDNSTQVVIKYNDYGVMVWQKEIAIDFEWNANGADADIDNDGNIYVLGTYSFGSGSGLCITKLDTDGVAQWTRKVQGPCYATAASIVVGDDNYLYISAITGTEVPGSPTQKMVQVLAKYNTRGVVEWQRYFKHSADWIINENFFGSLAGGSNLAIYQDRFAVGTSRVDTFINNGPLSWNGVIFQGPTTGIEDEMGRFSFVNSTLSGNLTSPYAVTDGYFEDVALFLIDNEYTAGVNTGNVVVTNYASTTKVENKLTNGDYTFALDEKGDLHATGNFVIGANNTGNESHLQIDASNYNTSIQWKNFNSPQDPNDTPFECQAQLLRVFATENTITNECDVDNPREEIAAVTVVRPSEPVNKNGIMISTSVDKIPDAPYNDGKGTRNNWIFTGDGKITFPDGSEQTAAYDLSRQLGKTLTTTENSVDVRADINLKQTIYGVIGTYLNQYNYDTIFHAATGDLNGNMYAIGISYEWSFTGYPQHMIVSWDNKGELRWSKRLGNETWLGQAAYLKNIQFNTANNSEIVVGYTTDYAYTTGYFRVNCDSGDITGTQQFLMTGGEDNLQQYDIHVNYTNDVFIAGHVNGEMSIFEGITAQAGSAPSILVVNWEDVGSPDEIYPWNTNTWQVDLYGTGSFVTPYELNTHYGMLVQAITGAGSGAGVDVQYYYDGTNWTYGYVRSLGGGSGYNYNDIVAVKGSTLGGTDSTTIVALQSQYTRNSVGDNTVWSFLTAEIGNMNTLNIADFELFGYWDGNSNYASRYILSEGTRWEININGDYTNLVYKGDPSFILGGNLVFVDTRNGSDLVGFFDPNSGQINGYNNRFSFPTPKVRFKMSQNTDFRGAENTTTFSSAGGAYNPGDYSVVTDGNGGWYIQELATWPAIGSALATHLTFVISYNSGTTSTVTINSSTTVTIPNLGTQGYLLNACDPAISTTTTIDALIIGNGTWPDPLTATWTVRHALDQQAFISKMGNWTITLGGANSQSTQSITTNPYNNTVYAVVDYNGSQQENVLVLALDNNDGSIIWQQWSENKDAKGGYPGSIVTDGNYVYVSSYDNNDAGIVTKFDASNGTIIWQIKHEQSEEWNNRPVLAYDEWDGNIVISGAFYETDYENDRVVPFWKIDAVTGKVLWKTMLVDRGSDRGFREYYNSDCQQFSIVGGYMYWGGYIDDDENEYYIGVASKLPSNGEGFGRYGRWEYMPLVDNYDWVMNTAKAESATPTVSLVNSMGWNTIGGQIVYAQYPNMLDSNNGLSSRPYGRPAGNLPGKVIFSDESEIAHPGIARDSVDTGDNTQTLSALQNGKFIYFNNSTNIWDSTIWIPNNLYVPLPIGYTVTVVISDFNGYGVFVNANNDSAVTIHAVGNSNLSNNNWYIGGDGIPSIYTIMKVDTNTWLIAGPNVQVD